VRLFQESAQQIQVKALRQLADGCKRHPSYRYRRAPTAKCKRCEELWSLKRRFDEWEALSKAQWEAEMEADRQQMREWSRRHEEMLNCPG
jgi:hypothetical protein